MKTLLITAFLLSTLVAPLPGRADCPPGQDGRKAMPAAKGKVVIKHETKLQKPAPEPDWHDLHWFE